MYFIYRTDENLHHDLFWSKVLTAGQASSQHNTNTGTFMLGSNYIFKYCLPNYYCVQHLSFLNYWDGTQNGCTQFCKLKQQYIEQIVH